MSLPVETLFPWTRYWVPADKPIAVSGSWWGEPDGFLVDPEQGISGKEGNAHLLPTAQLLTRRAGCWVLWGEPGMGKSQTLRAFASSQWEPLRIQLEFRDVPDRIRFEQLTVGSAQWAAWRASDALLTVIIDGVDEGLIKIEGFVGYLVDLLRTEPVSRLQLVLACRSLEWPRSEGQRLLQRWDASSEAEDVGGIYELCPLREKDVLLAAETTLEAAARTGTPDAFLAAVRRHRLMSLATRPLTLRMLLHEFSAGGGLSRSHRELYRIYSHHLCQEHDEERRHRLRHRAAPRLHLPPALRVRIAGRIAALLLIGGRSAIWPGNPAEAAKDDLTLADLMGGKESVGGVEFVIGLTEVETVLESPLFWPKAWGRIGFYHQTFAECLGAEYLSRLPLPQLRSLICGRDPQGEFVHPPLAELAAWISADHEPLLRHLLHHDPETLLRSDVSAIKAAHRAELVGAVLTKARAAELFDARGQDRFLHTLSHPGLAAQLRDVVRDRSANQVARRFALRIAERCQVTELLDDVLALLRDPRDTGIHSLAAAALDDLTTPDTVVRLVPLVERRRKPAFAPSVMLSLLHALLRHGHWSLAEALPYVDRALAPRDSSAFVLAQHAQPADAEGLLRGCLKWPGAFDRLARYHAFASKAHDLGVARLGETRIRRLVARVWWRARRQHRHDDWAPDDAQVPRLGTVLKSDPELRRLFIDDILALGLVTKEEEVWSLRELLEAEDFAYFLPGALLGSPRRREFYAHLAALCYDREKHACHWDELLRALSQSVELRAAFPWMRTWTLDEPGAVKARERLRERERWQAEVAQLRKPKPLADPVEVWRRDLKRLRGRDPKAWLTLACNLFYRASAEKPATERHHDIRTSPGWLHHDESARARIIAGACRFLRAVPGNPQHQPGGQSEFDSLAYRALFLLRDEIEKTPPLRAAVCRYWLPAILDEYSDDEGDHIAMVALAYRLDARAVRAWLKAALLRATQREPSHFFDLRKFKSCWDRPLATFVVRLVSRQITNAVTISDVTDWLAEHDGPSARALWLSLLMQREAKPTALLAATTSLATWRLCEYWDDLQPVLVADHELARKVFLGFDRMEQRRFLGGSPPLSDSRVAELFLLLRQLFPSQEDPPTPSGAYTPTARMEIARLRNELPAMLAARGTRSAAGELWKLAEQLPLEESLWIRWRWRDAVVASRRNAWQQPPLALVLELTRRTESRWLHDEDDLAMLVLESFGRLQDNLTNQPNSHRPDFWDPRPGPRRSKYYRPRNEVEMSRRIATWLQSDLAPGRGITVQREVQVQWDHRTDIEVRAVTLAGDALRPLEVVVEVKGCWHPKVRTAHRDQLAEGYLRRAGRTHGIYLVVWTKCPRWNDPQDRRRVKLRARTVDEARTEVARLVETYDGQRSPWMIHGALLDVGL